MAPHAPPSPRRPLPQPVEESTIPRKKRAWPAKADSSISSGSKPRSPINALPQPIETTSIRSKKDSGKEASSRDEQPHGEDPITSNERTQPQPIERIERMPSEDASSSQKQPRRFAPQMIDTTRRSRRNTDTSPCVTPQDKTDDSPGLPEHLPPHMRQHRPNATPIPPSNSPIEQLLQPPESKFSSSKLAEKAERRHSFRVPDLPVISSSQSESESNDSSIPSLSTSPSAQSDLPASNSKSKIRRRKSKERRESQDEQWSGYILSLAAQTAERQLREQAMAAYPNERLHEPVDHYAFDRDSDEDEEAARGGGKLSAEDSTEEQADRMPAGHRHRDSDAGWGLAEMRQHGDRPEHQKENAWAKGENVGRRRSTRTALREAQGADNVPGAPPKDIVGWQKDNEIKGMRKAASPPMAGQNLKFPQCQSPRATRLDVYQFHGTKKSDGPGARQHTGLWTPGGGASRQNSKSGLWMGVCNAANKTPATGMTKILPTGLLTPKTERSDPLSSPSSSYIHPPSQPQNQSHNLPLSPSSSPETAQPHLDSVLQRERTLDAELTDAFVTQVYNYLSLGFPSLARKFDAELAKITKIPLEDLRKDDGKTNARGYVGAPEGTGAERDPRGEMGGEERCERWCALRVYVREWGRQQPGMVGGGDGEVEGGWGARARKGSWGF